VALCWRGAALGTRELRPITRALPGSKGGTESPGKLREGSEGGIVEGGSEREVALPRAPVSARAPAPAYPLPP
jgi:hypothetical protein